jgi:hypothetical protein
MPQPAAGLRPGVEEVPDEAPASAGEAVPAGVVGPEPTVDRPDVTLPVDDAGRTSSVMAMPVAPGQTSTDVPAWRERLADADASTPVGAGSPTHDAGSGAAAGAAV